MNQEQLSSYSPEMAGLSNEGDPLNAPQTDEEQMKSIDDHHKRNVLGKVKEKARKLKTKIRKPKTGAEEAGEQSLSEDESGSDQENQPEEMETQMPEESNKDVSGILGDVMKNSSLVPDVNATTPGSGLGVHEELFGKTYSTSTDSSERLQEEVPSAAGQTSAGVTPYLTEHDIGKGPDDDSSENVQSMDTEETLETHDGVAGDAQNKNEPKKSMFEQAKQKIFGTSKSFTEGTKAKGSDESNKSRPSLTSRAADTMMSFKDAFTSKLGYGAKSPLNRSMSDKGERMEAAKEPAKSVLQKVQDTALNTALNTFETVVSKIGPSEVVDTVELKDSVNNTNDIASEIAPGSKDEGSHSSEDNVPVEETTRFHPGEEDRVLSQLITEKLSIGATTLKGALMRPFSSPGASVPSPLPETSSATDLVPNVSDDVGGIIATETKEVDAGNPRGIVSAVSDTVSAAGEKVSSLLTKGSEVGTGKNENLDETTGGLIASVRETVSSLVGKGNEGTETITSGDEPRMHTEAAGMGNSGGVMGKGNDGPENVTSVDEPRMHTEGVDMGNSGGVISAVSETVSSLIGKGKEKEDLRKTNTGDEAGICTVEMQQAS